MAKSELQVIFTGEVLEEDSQITLIELCRTCSVQAETIEALVEHGILEPTGKRGHHWCFPAGSVQRIRVTLRLQQDLGVNVAGAALALELLDRIDELNARLRAAGSI